MLTTVVVPLDGSRVAEWALPFAEALARGGRVPLTLLRVVADGRDGGQGLSDAQAQAVAEAEVYLEEVAAQFQEPETLVQVTVRCGDAAQAIVQEATARRPAVIAMATHGVWSASSVSESICSRCDVPVLLVHRPPNEGDPMTLSKHPRLLVPLDGSRFGESAVDTAAELAEMLDGNVALVKVVEAAETDTGGFEPAQARAASYLERVEHRLIEDHAGVSVQSLVRVGDASSAIAQAIDETGAAMVIMATHGPSRPGGVLFGSVTGAVMRHSRVPVLVVRPSASD